MREKGENSMADSDVIDPVQFVKNLISNNYAAVASYSQNSDTPDIINGYFNRKFNFAKVSGGIFVYTITDIIGFDNYAARLRNDRVWRLSIDFAFKDRNYMLSNVNLVRRILEVNANVRSIVPESGYQNCYNLLYEVDAKDKTNKFDHFHRYIIDVELTLLGKVRATAL